MSSSRSDHRTSAVPTAEQRFEIEQALLAYMRGIDSKDYELFRSGFHPDVRMTFAKWVDPLEGLDRLAVFMEVLHRSLDGSAHRTTNLFFREFEPGRAVVDSYVHALLVRTGHPGGDTFDVYATYTDELREGSDGWTVTSKHAVQLLDTGNSAVLEFDAAAAAAAAVEGPRPEGGSR